MSDLETRLRNAIRARRAGVSAPRPSSSVRRSLPCIHEGPIVEFCPVCRGGDESRHVRDCGHPDNPTERCTRGPASGLVWNCAACDRYSLGDEPALPPSSKRHLIMHVLPVAGNGVWRRAVAQARAREPLFTGSKTVAVMTDPKPGWLDPPDAVRAAVPDDWVVLTLPNDPTLREVVSWAPLWGAALRAARPEDAVFYCHAKGVTRPVDPGNTCHWWASLQWSLNLDHWGLVSRHLSRHPITGAFKKIGRGFRGNSSTWHYSGAFFWVLAGDMVNRPWSDVPRRWWGNEAWPGIAYRPDEAACLFLSADVSTLDLYRPSYWAGVVLPEYAKWLQSNPPAWPWVTSGRDLTPSRG